MKEDNAIQLLEKIIQCSNINDAFQNIPSKCKEVVMFQEKFLEKHKDKLNLENKAVFAVPEPWSGDILKARILLISSNPSISTEDFTENQYPLKLIQNAKLTSSINKLDYYDFFTNRFQKEIYTSNEEFLAVPFWRTIEDWYLKLTKNKNSNGLVSKVNRYRGKDFVITELVHCKSKSEVGVSEAMDTCFDKWFEKIIQLCKAKIIIILGAESRDKILVWLFPENRDIINERGRYIEPYPKLYTLFNKKLSLVFFPHPSAKYGSPDLYSFIQRAYKNGFYGKENKEKKFSLERLQISVHKILNRD